MATKGEISQVVLHHIGGLLDEWTIDHDELTLQTLLISDGPLVHRRGARAHEHQHAARAATVRQLHGDGAAQGRRRLKRLWTTL
ncbi:MAG: hypothetical protein R3A10_01965 [Caldilineaceae bacterium]